MLEYKGNNSQLETLISQYNSLLRAVKNAFSLDKAIRIKITMVSQSILLLGNICNHASRECKEWLEFSIEDILLELRDLREKYLKIKKNDVDVLSKSLDFGENQLAESYYLSKVNLDKLIDDLDDINNIPIPSPAPAPPKKPEIIPDPPDNSWCPCFKNCTIS